MSVNPDYSFQDEAVEAVASDFSAKRFLKTLLVIPTGGGKTRTAIKSLLRLHDDGYFAGPNDQILWVAHREELLEQAKSAFQDEGWHPRCNEALGRTIFRSNVTAGDEMLNNDRITLVVIDEAHHSAAQTYLPLFRPSVGVLGLTATPSRHDGAPLEFEKESFSIGFPDLERLGIVLKPTVIELEGIASDLRDFTDAELGKLNTSERNGIIRDALMARKSDLDKVVVYVGTKQHARDLWEVLSSSELAEHYQSISYVLGGDGNNSRGQDRRSFFEEEKRYDRSITVNVQVLTEGYDDPKVNAVVMATPFKSKLTYMQCMGRAVRRDESNPAKRAFVLELVEDLPNIRYRIDNRWIYSEISDVLEPAIVDRKYSGIEGLKEELEEIYTSKAVTPARRVYPQLNHPIRPQLLIFKCLSPSREIYHEAVLMSEENRRRVQNWFNFLSTKLSLGRLRNVNRTQALNMIKAWWGDELSDQIVRANIYDAMCNSLELNGSSSPWITLVTFTEIPHSVPDDLEQFLDDAVNRDEISPCLSQATREGRIVLKFPLPLSGSFARICTIEDADAVEVLVNEIRQYGSSVDDQVFRLLKRIQAVNLSLEYFLLESIPRIVREKYAYRFDLRNKQK